MTQIETDAQLFLPVLDAITPLIRAGIYNEVIYDDKGYGIKLGGFYKDGTVTVRPRRFEASVVVEGRYDTLGEFFNPDELCSELINLNAERFRYWNSVKPEFDKIDPSWLPLLIQQGLVKKVETYTLA